MKENEILKASALRDLKVIKRDGKKVSFNGEKIALAIKKAFDSVEKEEYTMKDANKIYNDVLDMLEGSYKDKTTINIESIQDMIEETLNKHRYVDVYESFSSYREKRAQSRKVFEERQHKLIKAIESLSFNDASEADSKRDNANVDGNTAMGTMLQYGSTISKEFAKSYLINSKYSVLHDSGQIHIHDMDFLPMGTTTCMQIDLPKIFESGFSTGHGFLRCPNDIMSYTALAAIAIQSNQNDQHGGQSVPAFDLYMAPGVIKSFRKIYKQLVYDLLDFSGFLNFIDFNKVEKEINKIDSIELDVTRFDMFCKEEEQAKRVFEMAYEKAMLQLDKRTYQAMEAFIHNLNTMHSRAGAQVPFSSINLGTDTTPEGRMVTKNYLLATEKGLGKGETPIFPIVIFKTKEGINYNPTDPNYDLFKLACRVSAKRLFPNFSFLDSPFNKKFYVPGDYRTEVVYMGCRTRVMGNVADPTKQIAPGRGNLSFTSINLPRLGIKHGIVSNPKTNLDAFFEELESMIEQVKNQLMERYAIQCNMRVKNFPFLMGQGIWLDSDKLKPSDKVKRVLKHGTLTIGFIGLAECLKALIGKHHGESEEAQKLGLKIIEFMKKKTLEYQEEYKLNFTVIATPAEGLSGRFTAIDKSIYGNIPGVTDREYYTNSFHIPVHYKISIANKIKLEGPYHALTDAGHITYIELDGDTVNNQEAFEKIIRLMHDNNVGYGAINHPVDRDPICGFTGVIGNVCPGCNRTEADGVHFERIRRITGYLVGTVDRFNNGKKAEERDRLKHSTESE